jgi:hypothetical protein
MDVVVNIYQGWTMSVNTNTNFHPSKSPNVILARVLAESSPGSNSDLSPGSNPGLINKYPL